MAKQRILVAEDERPMAKALQLKLTSSGYDVDVANDGKEALDLLDNGSYDLLILDLMMPNIDGFGVLKELQERKTKMPVVVASNLSQEEDAKRAKSMGAAAFFVKSNTPLAELVLQIQKIIA